MKLSKGILFVILFIFTIGCSYESFSKEQSLANLINKNNIIKIELHSQGLEPVKTISNNHDIEELFNYFENVLYKKSSIQEDVNGWSYFLVFYYEDGTESTILFVSNRVKYNGIWYDIDKDIRNQIEDYYNTLSK